MEILKRIGAFFLDILEVIVFAVAIFLFLYLTAFQPHKVKGNSMQPNYPDGEYLLTEKITYRFNEPQRGEVVVFEAPSSPGEEYIKRIIGLPGDIVSVNGGKIYINQKILEEAYIAANVYTNGGYFLRDGSEATVPSGNYFVLGDNRTNSSDSRAWGFVPKRKIVGKAWFIYWPVSSLGKVPKVEYSF